jgi:hypothetical protein
MDENLHFNYSKSSTTGRLIAYTILIILEIIFICIFLFGLLKLLTSIDLLESVPFLIIGGSFAFFILLGILSVKWSTRYELKSAYFDLNENKFFIITNNNEKSFIPFSEINSLAIRKYVKNKSTGYILYLEKKDGAYWDIQLYGGELTARKALNNLESKINFTSNSNFEAIEDTLETKFSKKQDSFSTLFHWKAETKLYKSILSFFGIISFLIGFIYILYLTGSMESTVKYFFIGFFILFTFIIVLSIFKQMFGYKEFELEITNQELKLFGIKNKSRKQIQVMNLNEIVSTQFGYDILNQSNQSKREIHILNQEALDVYKKVKSDKFEIMDILSTMQSMMQISKKIIKLEFEEFTVTEVLSFEKELDKTLQSLQRSN